LPGLTGPEDGRFGVLDASRRWAGYRRQQSRRFADFALLGRPFPDREADSECDSHERR